MGKLNFCFKIPPLSICLYIVMAAMAATAFLIGLFFPLEMAAIPYVAVVWVSLWVEGRWPTMVAAILSSVLTISTVYVSPSTGEFWEAVFKGVLAIYAMWMTAIFSLSQKKHRQDVTSRERWLQYILDLIPFLMVIRTRDGRILLANQSSADTCGMAVDDLLQAAPEEIKSRMVNEVRRLKQNVTNGEPLGHTVARTVLNEPVDDASGSTRMVGSRKILFRDSGSSDPAILTIAMGQMEFYDLRQLHHLTRHVFDASPDLIAVLGPDYRYRLVNPAYAWAHGLDRWEIEGMPLGKFYGEKVFRDMVQPHIDRCLSGIEVRQETWWTFQQKGRRFMSVLYSPVNDDQQCVQEVVMIFRDLTERILAEDSLRTREQQYRLVMDNVPAMIMLFDLTHSYRLVNRRFLDWFGLAPEQVVGKHASQILGRGGYKAMKRQMEEACLGHRLSFETQVPDKRGERRWVAVQLVPYVTEQDGVEGMFALVDDIHEQKQMEEQVTESEVRYRDLYEFAPLAYFSASHDWSLTKVNARAVELFGYAKEELIGRNVSELCLAMGTENCPSMITPITALARDNLEGIELPMRRGDGRKVWVNLTVQTVYGQKGCIVERRGIVQDITYRKIIEEQLRASENRYRSLIEQASIGIYEIDLNGNVISMNPAGLRMFDCKDERKLVGCSLLDLMDDPDRERIGQSMNQAAQGQTVDIELLKKNGNKVRWYSSSFIPITHHDGTPAKILGLSYDFTHRKRLEEALQKSQRAFADLVNSIEGIVWECEFPSYQFTFMSQQAERLLGYPIHYWLNDTCFFKDHIHPDDRQWVLAYCFEETVQKRDHQLEYRMIAADGRVVWVRDLVTVVVEQNEPVKVRGVMVDMTERKHMEEQLEETQRFTNAIIDNIPDMVFVKHAKDLRFVSMNKAGESLLGYTRADLIGKNDYDFFPKEEADFFTAHDRQVLYSQMLLEVMEEPIQTRHQGIRLLHTKKIPLCDQEGTPQYLLGISEDITERKYAENALRESEERFRTLAHHAPVGIFLADAQGNCLFVNENWCYLSGLSFEEACGQGWAQAIHPQDRDRVWFDWYESVRCQDPFRAEYRIRTREGRESWVVGSAVPRLSKSETGGVTEYIGVCIDITTLKQLEAEIRFYAGSLEQEVERRTIRIRELEQRRMQVEKLASLSQVAAGIAHEINNPLASITQSFELLKRALSPDHPRFKYLGKVEDAVGRITTIVRQLYQLYTPEGQRHEPVDLMTLVRNAMEIMQIPAAANHITLKKISSQDALVVNLHKNECVQVLCNLIQNAIEASPTGAEVTVQIRRRDSEIDIAVQDQGKGIRAEILPHIFDPFFTTKQGTSQSGMGLGLALCHRLVEAMGGAISVKSEPGKGATFTVSFPLAEKT